MRKHKFILFALFISLWQPLFSQTELLSDTLKLLPGTQRVHFDLDHSEYHHINFYVYLKLNPDCQFHSGEFFSLSIANQNQKSDIEKVEFARIYLPSHQEHQQIGNEFIYEFDMTLWQIWLKKDAYITIDFSGKKTEAKLVLSFQLQDGTPPVQVLEIIPLWQSDIKGFPYGKNGIDKKNLEEQKVLLPDETETAFINVLVSGKQRKTMAKRLASKFYFLSINGQEIAKRNIWRSDCGLNPIYPQYKYWYKQHPNWCPGLRVNPLLHPISASLIAEKELNINLTFQKDPHKDSGIDSYITSAVLFALAKAENNLNVSIEEIVAPNMDLWHHRYNPICGSPILLIQNKGYETVKSITFNYGYNYETDNKYRWQGELSFMEEEIVYLPPVNWYFYNTDDMPETFTAHISSVNGEETAFADGKKTSLMELAAVLPHQLTFELETEDVAFHNTLEIYDEDGQMLYFSKNLQGKNKYSFNLNLHSGCYELILFDEEGNGVKWSHKDSYFFTIKDKESGRILKKFQADFGSEIREQFMILR